ncbi:hypothetical protein BT96DRAFT_919484 [Gymnopus androsaceus JB14]|uniref:CENP-V/GFA domain-containing protein n=1 Tax=Gymnopus androsaceus JB14 TaxID=1447944 RepID=A0A6A4HQV7_9AGAR|nr:hypothetical protein BT96DRAFT_919484 [Gymnopus androsaceus JB14]
MPYSGSCLCGETKIEVSSTHNAQIACHCTDCRQTSGSSNSTNILPLQSDVQITGAVKEYNSKAASGNTVTRIFCSNCGCAMAHKSKVFGDKMAVQTGTLPDFATIPFEAELFCKSKFTGLGPFPNAAQKDTM